MTLWLLMACLPDFPSSTLAEDPGHDFDGDGFVEEPGDGSTGDCNDWDPAVNPAAIEVCDGVDNDCDARVDDRDSSLEADDWWADADGDGYGDPDVLVESRCDPGDGTWVLQADDCDDTNADVFPGASEVCDDGLDSDCDGIRLCELTPETILLGERASDRLGMALALPGDLDGDGQADLALGAEGYDAESGDALANAGAVYLVWGPVESGIDDVADVSLRLVGAQGSFAGLSVGAAGDMDGDGLADLIVGAPATETFRGVSPRIHFVLGPSGTGELELDTVPTWHGDHAVEALAGWSVDGCGDVDGDGLSDVVVGAPGDASQTGEVVILTGAEVSGETSPVWTTVLNGDQADDGVGETVKAAGDVDGDGLGDFLVGAQREGSDDRGTVWLVLAADLTEGVSSLDGVGLAFRGLEPGQRVGSGLEVGDLNGDGLRDLVLGAAGLEDGDGNSNGGFLLVEGGSAARVSGDLAQVTTQVTGDEPAQGLGTEVTVGDVDADGRDDMVLKVRKSELVGSADNVVVLLGPLEGIVPVGSGHWKLSGVQAEGSAGSSLALGEDLLEDAGMVLVIGSSDWTDSEQDQGAVLLVPYPGAP